MKYLIDANLPYKLKLLLEYKGFDEVHTDNLPKKESTSDGELRKISIDENRIIVTKDSDFFDSYHISKIPKKLLFITTGNIHNKILLDIFSRNIDKINKEFNFNDLIELNSNEIIIYG
jgi:predicted nuclease of predicted toxin-antitoxin system